MTRSLSSDVDVSSPSTSSSSFDGSSCSSTDACPSNISNISSTSSSSSTTSRRAEEYDLNQLEAQLPRLLPVALGSYTLSGRSFDVLPTRWQEAIASWLADDLEWLLWLYIPLALWAYFDDSMPLQLVVMQLNLLLLALGLRMKQVGRGRGHQEGIGDSEARDSVHTSLPPALAYSTLVQSMWQSGARGWKGQFRPRWRWERGGGGGLAAGGVDMIQACVMFGEMGKGWFRPL